MKYIATLKGIGMIILMYIYIYTGRPFSPTVNNIMTVLSLTAIVVDCLWTVNDSKLCFPNWL